ncbi:LPS translocon maturation chaperone LptM [Vibrio fluvialis]|uniref:Lipopeptide n=1 Tax=Vibrio fluvialis PG41 TaxID=1336752 RepID=S7JD53_VIBFL|nr:lipopeptide [Vibrio fluvialis PG41]
MKKSITALFVLSLLTLAGCGQTGPLYMPDDAQQSEQNQ